MLATVTQLLQGVSDPLARAAHQTLLGNIADRLSSQTLSSAGLVINAASSPLVKTGAAATVAVAQGIPVSIAAATALPALAGTTIPQNGFGIAVFYVDRTGTLTTAMATPATTLAAVVWPPAQVGKATLGFVIITPASATFIPGTTALDAAGVTATYVNTQGAFDPTILV